MHEYAGFAAKFELFINLKTAKTTQP